MKNQNKTISSNDSEGPCKEVEESNVTLIFEDKSDIIELNKNSNSEVDENVYVLEKLSMSIPNDYNHVLRWMDENKSLILENPSLIKKILLKLNKLLFSVHNTKSFKKDVKIIIKAIKTEYEALFKECNSNLNVSKIINMINNKNFKSFFENCKRLEKTFIFEDFLQIDKEFKVREKSGKKVENTILGDLQHPDKVVEISEKESILEINRIKNLFISKNGDYVSKFIDGNGRINYFKLILDPKSLSRTIYNSYNVSLAMRLNAIEFFEEDNQLFVREKKNLKKDEKSEKFTHSVLIMDKEKYTNLIEEHNIKESIL